MAPKAFSYIRFSTPKQQWGDSLRRQSELSMKYAEEHGLALDESLKPDKGLSAYSGKHITEGALGHFLALVKAGQIPEGSVLLVESLDRLSREEITKALNQFLAIIESGVKIVTLADNNREYTKESINANWSELIISLAVMSRAHEESKIKAFRLAKAWEGKREKALNGGKKLTKKCPAWLELSKDETFYQLIPERGPIIEKIFTMKLNGKSSKRIAQEFNQSENFPWKPVSPRHHKQAGWWPSYIEKILRNRAVLGEFQPHKLIDGKRMPVGEPIKGYFPVAFDDAEDLFYSVQALFKSSQVSTKSGAIVGKAGNTKVSNLFTHVIKCGYCGASMHFLDKSPWTYFVCSSALRRAGCVSLPVPYPEIEDAILRYCRGLNPADLLPGREEVESKIRLLQGQLTTVQGKLEEANQQADNLIDSIADTKAKEIRKRLEAKLQSVLEEKKALEKQYETGLRDFEVASRSTQNMQERLESLGQLFEAIGGALQGQELVDLKLRLRQELRRLIARIDVFPEGNPRQTQEWADRQLQSTIEMRASAAFMEKHRQSLEEMVLKRKQHLELVVRFVGGSSQTLQPRQPLTRTGELDIEAGVYRDYYGADDNVVCFELPLAKPALE